MTALATSTRTSVHDDRSVLRLGGLCAVAGGVLGVVLNLLHPRTSEIGAVEAELRLIRDNGQWLAVHVGILATLVIAFLGLVAIAYSMYGERGLWARTALYAAVAAAPVALVSVALDGIAMKAVADAWATAPEQWLPAADAVGQVNIAAFDGLIIGLFGLMPIFLGISLAGSSLYPHWTGIVSVAGGALGLIAGFTQAFNGLEPLTTNIVFPLASLAFTIVLIVTGATLWQKTSAPVS
jgi:hypothetical protein